MKRTDMRAPCKTASGILPLQKWHLRYRKGHEFRMQKDAPPGTDRRLNFCSLETQALAIPRGEFLLVRKLPLDFKVRHVRLLLTLLYKRLIGLSLNLELGNTKGKISSNRIGFPC